MTKKEQPLLGQALFAAIFNNPKEIKMPWYRKIFKARSGHKRIRLGRYSDPFQGEREMARRKRQIERGIIKP